MNCDKIAVFSLNNHIDMNCVYHDVKLFIYYNEWLRIFYLSIKFKILLKIEIMIKFVMKHYDPPKH